MPTEDHKDLWESIGRMSFVIWFCPDRREHERNRDRSAPQKPTVEWVDGVGHCLEPGCGNKSTDKIEKKEQR